MFKESKIPNFLFWLEVSDFRTITTINTKNNLQNICQNCFQITVLKTVVEPLEDRGGLPKKKNLNILNNLKNLKLPYHFAPIPV